MPRLETERPILMIRRENQPTQQVPISRDEIIVGRDESCDVPLPERQISRQHIRIYRQNDRFYVQDLDSKNGTWINGQPLKGSTELHDGDEIQLALTTRIRFVGIGSTAPLTSEVPVFANARLRLEHESRRVFIGDRELDPPLSLPQYRLLELLYNNLGSICTRDMVIETVWPEAMGEGVSEQAIDALVRRLRDRLAELDPDQQYIITVRGHGFRLENPVDHHE
ncbi:MAG: FHA domain-containing protein [Chloroflexi bacterium]|nr:FHA domain-containing protein [Chloroflexota bacterium]MDL1883520.1 FHA domain-containing protein [Anaerolineae bacterium CFX8]